jgi:transposase-like protein
MEKTIHAARRRIRRSPEQWRELFARFEQSGQSREQFCTAHDLGVSTFGRWRQRLRRERRVSAAAGGDALFVELAQETSARAAPPWEVELQLGAGVILRLRQAPC